MRQLHFAIALIVCAAVAATTSAASARTVRADLTVTNASVTATATVLSGSFTVHSSRRGAGASSAVLSVTAAGNRRVLKRFAVPAVRAGASRVIKVAVPLPSDLPAGWLRLVVCADATKRVREHAEDNNCHRAGIVVVAAAPSVPVVAPLPTETTETTTAPPLPLPLPLPLPPPPAPRSTVPTAPLSYTVQTPQHLSSGEADYWVVVPAKYDRTHATPIALLVGLHGCGDTASNYLDWAVRPWAQRLTQSYIAVSVGGRDGTCWSTPNDSAKVLAAIADVRTHFNIESRHIVISGYSSGGNLAYRTAFDHAGMFAGVLAMACKPFSAASGPGSSADSIAGAAWKLNVVHIAHTADDNFRIEIVRPQLQALVDAGFPTIRIERPGDHNVTDVDAGILVSHMDDPWQAPPS